MSVRALGYIGLGVSDVERWRVFATEILGLQSAPAPDIDSCYLRMDDRRFRIAVHPGLSDDLLYAGWEVADESELNELAKRLSDRGYMATMAGPDLCAKRHVGGLLISADPSGITSEFFWGPDHDLRSPFRSPRGIEQFVTGDDGLGHIVLTVNDAEATMQFYRDTLGFRVSDFIEFERSPGMIVRMAFLHCNRRHHSIAFMQTPSPRHLSHIMLEVAEMDDVGRTYTLCERQKVPISMTLGRHSNDEMFSFYVTTPSGFNIEYGWGGRLIDDAIWQVGWYDSPSVWGHNRLVARPINSTIIVSKGIANMSSIWVDLLGAQVRYRGRDFKTRTIEMGEHNEKKLILIHGVGGHAEAYSRNLRRLSETTTPSPSISFGTVFQKSLNLRSQ